mgnify:CR=1 FL=1
MSAPVGAVVANDPRRAGGFDWLVEGLLPFQSLSRTIPVSLGVATSSPLR